MNKKKILLFSLAALASGSTLMAQTGQWKLTGNNLNGTQKLGSTNNFSLDFITNNVKRMSLTNTGNVGIGTTAPLSRLHVRTGSSGITPFSQSVITAENSSNAYINILAPSANETGILFGNSSGNVSGGIIYNSAFLGSAPNALQFRTNGNFPRMVLTADGNVGIGTTTPKTNLHVFRGSTGVFPNVESPIVAEANGNSFINLLTPVANVSGILFGNNSNVADGGIVYGGVSHRMELRTKGNVTRMVITGDGNVGIGTANPQSVLQIETGSSNFSTGLSVHSHGSDAIDAVSDTGPGIVAGTNNSSSFAGVFHGDVLADTYQSSDEKLKQNIHDFTSAMSIINELHPKLYQFKKDGNYALLNLPRGDHYGLIAQEVEKILPNLVKEIKFDTRLIKPGTDREKSSPSDKADFKTLNYTELIPIIIKAVQELSKENSDLKKENAVQQKQNDDLQKRIEGLEAIMLKGNQQSTISNQSLTISSASLEQNVPNPFSNSTTIHYILPQKYTTAQIIITDKNGKTIKRLNVSGAGKGTVNVDAAMLSSGTYHYSLIVDGKVLSTKQMMVAR